MPLVDICEGRQFHIVAYSVGENRQRVLTFIAKGSGKDAVKLAALLDRCAEYGIPRNDQKFKQLEGPIYEFKAGQARLACFFHEKKLIVCVHGFVKKKSKTDHADIDKAAELRKLYLAEFNVK